MGSAIEQQLSRLLTCALVVCMVAALMPAAAFAAPAVESGDGAGANAFTGSGGTAQANTEMYLSVAQRFRAAEAFVSPAATTTTNPSVGLPAVENSVWKANWSTNNGSAAMTQRPYTIESSSSCPCAPSIRTSGSITTCPTMPSTSPSAAAKMMHMVK